MKVTILQLLYIQILTILPAFPEALNSFSIHFLTDFKAKLDSLLWFLSGNLALGSRDVEQFP